MGDEYLKNKIIQPYISTQAKCISLWRKQKGVYDYKNILETDKDDVMLAAPTFVIMSQDVQVKPLPCTQGFSWCHRDMPMISH